MTELERLQRWMLSVITHPGGIAGGLSSAEARAGFSVDETSLEEIIERSRAQSSRERLEVYHNAFFARLIECLAAEFPATKAVCGDEAFAGFVIEYLSRFPPESWTLAQLGRQFPEFLQLSRPGPAEADDETEADWPRFLIELASLERLDSEVFDGPGEEGEPGFNVERLQQLAVEDWERVRLDTSRSLRLMVFEFPVHNVVRAVRWGETFEIPAPAKTWLAVFRRDYLVRRLPLTAVQYELLSRLKAGQPLGAAIEASCAAIAEGPQSSTLAAQIGEWFRNWTAMGLFRDLSLQD